MASFAQLIPQREESIKLSCSSWIGFSVCTACSIMILLFELWPVSWRRLFVEPRTCQREMQTDAGHVSKHSSIMRTPPLAASRSTSCCPIVFVNRKFAQDVQHMVSVACLAARGVPQEFPQRSTMRNAPKNSTAHRGSFQIRIESRWLP